MKKQPIVNVGIYCRLSVDDQNTGDSESIQTQKAILTDYCKNNHFNIIDYYVDDGFSGTNFDRPEFHRMLKDIERGHINTVMCKDLSRFGRNYSEAGMYLEKYFVEKDVRFIAPGNNVDTYKADLGINVPIINMMNDFYARDISAKTKQAKRARAKQGMFIGPKAPYGYMRDPEDRHHLVIDEEAAQIVRRIFQMACEGNGFNHIAKVLHEEGICPPSAYAASKDPAFVVPERWNKQSLWHVTSVQRILTNPVYTGKLVQGRRENKVMKGKCCKTPEEDWIVVENTHEAIISDEVWQHAQQQLTRRKRSCADDKPQMFAGLLYCSDCGSALSFSRIKRKGKPDDGRYRCWYHLRHGDKFCSSHYITLSALKHVVLSDIRQHAFLSAHQPEDYTQALTDVLLDHQKKDRRLRRKEHDQLVSRNNALDGIIKKLLEQNAAGVISDARFAALSADYEQEQQEIRARLEQFDDDARKETEIVCNAHRFSEIIARYTDLQELDARILNTLIDKIVVYQREYRDDGTFTQQIDIYYRFVGVIPTKLKNVA